jgi:hypothetical protein
MEKNELIITALQQRIGQLVANYEMDLALIRAEYTQSQDINNEKDETIKDYSKSLEEKAQIEETLRESIRLYEEDIRVLVLRYEKLEKTYESYKKKKP